MNTCPDCGCLYAVMSLKCPDCIQVLSHKAYLELQREYIAAIRSDRYELRLRRHNDAKDHIELVGAPKQAFCGILLRVGQKSRIKYSKLPTGFTCKLCLEALREIPIAQEVA